MKMFSLLSATAALAVASAAFAQGGASFAAAVAYSGPQTVSGNYVATQVTSQLVFSALDQQIRGGMVSTRTYNLALTAGAAFRAETSQTAGRAAMDTIMRARNSANTQFAFDDDTGAGAYSLFNSTVPGDGQVNIDVTRYASGFPFPTGTSNDPAEYFDLNVYQTASNHSGVNVQWYRFTGLGGFIDAEVLSSTGYGDTMLAAFDSAGNMLGSNDDFTGLLSHLTLADEVAVPTDGVIYFAVTNYRPPLGSDTNPASYINDAESATNGVLSLRVTPTPGTAALLGLGGLVSLRRRRA